MNNRAKSYNYTSAAISKLKDLSQLVKFNLTFVVVVTSALSYAVMAQSYSFSPFIFSLLLIGGFFVACAANTLNQVLEKDFDILMTRTKDRPIAAGRMKISEGVMIAGLLCLVGIICLALINPLTAFLGMISMVIYAFIYTPLKRYSTIAVAVGAIPGALPVLIGTTAVTGEITTIGLVLFAIQFLWQFPHFWAIGFLGFEDYHKAGYKLVPATGDNIDRNIGLHSTIYAVVLLPLCLVYSVISDATIWISSLAIVLSLIYVIYSYRFYKGHNRESARSLMFFSFFYMPAIFIIYLIA